MKYPTWWKGKIPSQHSVYHHPRQAGKSLHFRNIAPKQTRKKGIRKENPLPLRNNYYYDAIGVDWGHYSFPQLSFWLGTPEERAIGGNAPLLNHEIELQMDLRMTEASHTIWMELMAATTPTRTNELFYGRNQELSQRSGHRNNFGVTTPGSLIWASGTSTDWADAVVYGNSNRIYQVEFAAHPYHKYPSIWALVKDWVSDEQIRTPTSVTPKHDGEYYYKLITEAPGFSDVRYDGEFYVFGKNERYSQNSWCLCNSKPNIDFTSFKAFLFQYEFHHKSGKWALRIQHKTDRDGPCGTCRDLMEAVPVEVEGILL